MRAFLINTAAFNLRRWEGIPLAFITLLFLNAFVYSHGINPRKRRIKPYLEISRQYLWQRSSQGITRYLSTKIGKSLEVAQSLSIKRCGVLARSKHANRFSKGMKNVPQVEHRRLRG